MIIPCAVFGGGVYQIQNSGSFDGTNDHLFRTFGTPTVGKAWTLSLWFKRGSTGTNDMLFEAFTAADDAGRGFIILQSDDKWAISGGSTTWRVTTATFTNTTTFDHYVFTYDGGNATAGDRHEMFVNNAEITSFGTSNNIALDSLFGQLNSATRHSLGINETDLTSNPLHGLLADVHFIDGQALSPSDFGETVDSVWVPKRYEGTYGNNGFLLEFQNGSDLGEDTSGNGNNWTNSGVTQSTTTPTNP